MKLEIPPPLPDEIVFSTIARARYRLGWPTKTLSRALFDGRLIIVRPHLCGQLDLVARAAADAAGWSFSAEHLREKHTLVPLARPLLSDRTFPKCVAALHGDRIARNYVGVCRRSLGVTAFTQLQTCPQCRREDRSIYGESYFHRIHQIPGLRVCAHHSVPLETCAITAEPDFYIALDELTDFRRLKVPRNAMDQQITAGTHLWELMCGSATPTSALLLLAQVLKPSTPSIFSLVEATIAIGAQPPEASLVLGQRQLMETSFMQSRLTDTDWLEHARDYLPTKVSELRSNYPRRIAWMTLKLALESTFHARLPIRNRIPQTAAFIQSYVESSHDADRRLLAIKSLKQAA